MEDLTYESKSGYDLRPEDRFRYGGEIYRAMGEPRGEFNAYVFVHNERTGHEGEIIIRHTDRVELLK